MLEVLQRSALPGATSSSTGTAVPSQALVAGWRDGLSIINLRGPAELAEFRESMGRALGLELPVKACTTVANDVLRIVWAGPDDWFVIGPRGQAGAIEARLRAALDGLRHAVTDVSSGYAVLHMSGAPVRDVLAQGCPLDLHPRAFPPGASAGSHFFKASVWLWQAAPAPDIELLVRRSFMDYFWLMLQRTTVECGLVERRFA